MRVYIAWQRQCCCYGPKKQGLRPRQRPQYISTANAMQSLPLAVPAVNSRCLACTARRTSSNLLRRSCTPSNFDAREQHGVCHGEVVWACICSHNLDYKRPSMIPMHGWTE